MIFSRFEQIWDWTGTQRCIQFLTISHMAENVDQYVRVAKYKYWKISAKHFSTEKFLLSKNCFSKKMCSVNAIQYNPFWKCSPKNSILRVFLWLIDHLSTTIYYHGQFSEGNISLNLCREKISANNR